tara:strand:+ start:146 stop:295 length:150 start_codon:yes stop_codon:yes gene_type:complete
MGVQKTGEMESRSFLQVRCLRGRGRFAFADGGFAKTWLRSTPPTAVARE